MGLALRNTYATELEGMYLPFRGSLVPDPQVLRLNRGLAAELGIEPDAPGLARMLAGIDPPEGAVPLAMAYAGHQFGGFSPSLGDGRAMLLTEVTDSQGRLRDIHLKGSGRTPFSRGADGKAALGPVLREYLMGEAMFALGVPTTRALAVVTTGERVLRDKGMLPGAILARVAASHLRVGTFQFFAARGEVEQVRRLLGYAAARHDPDLAPGDALGFLGRVADRQARLIAQWMGLGFIHGVMNTDNMTVSGETIDYGPCAFMEAHDPATVFSSIDHQGRYAYGNQPAIARWNIARLAEALLPLIDADEDKAVAAATAVVDGFVERYLAEWDRVLGSKIGLAAAGELGSRLLTLMQVAKADHTLTFRSLAQAVDDPAAFLVQLQGADAARDWLAEWQAEVARQGGAADMASVNPAYVPRNHLVEEALAAAESGDMGPFDALLDVLRNPYVASAGLERYALPAPSDFGIYRTFCGT
jgi:serine/tyrosine/threonine adenylyltransferase